MEDPALTDGPLPDASLMDANMETSMDGNMEANINANMDDLFGDALPLPAPIPSELALRIADMQSRGCCTKLAWASTGSVAQVKNNDRTIAFRALIRDQKTGAWPLTEESKHPILAEQDATWEHIQFSNLGTDLAAIDSHGRVLVYSLTGPLGVMPAAQLSIKRNEAITGDSNAVIGLHWLPVYPSEFKFPYIAPAIKTGEKWKAGMQHRDQNEPSVHNAIDNRSALLYVTRDAKLTLMYQIESVWHAVESKLEDINSSDELLSHAAMGEEGDTVLLITHDISRRFRLYRVSVGWNATQHPRPGGGPSVSSVAPVLNIGRLTVLDHVAAQHADAARLSQLHIVPVISSHASDPNAPTYSNILAIFTRVSVTGDLPQQHQDAFSVIARWHVESSVPVLHEAFSKLKTNGTTATPQTTVTSLRRQEDVVTNKLVLSVEPQYFNTMLAFAASDGTIEFRERITMASIEPYPDTTSVTSLPQSGFEHLMSEHYLHVAMSRDGSALATARSNGSLSHKMMTLRYTWHPVMDDGGLIEAAVVCLARQYAILCCSSVANDETLMLLPSDLSLDMRLLFVREVIDILGRSPLLDLSMQDVNRQQQAVIREALLPKALSAQYVLGCKPGTTQLTFMGKYAFAFLNTRLVAASLFPLASNKPEICLNVPFLITLRGLARWGSDLLVYLVGGLMAVKQVYDTSDSKDPKSAFDGFTAEHDNPIVHLLLCTFSRAMVRFLGSFIPRYLNCVNKAEEYAKSVSDRQELQEIYSLGTSLPFRYADFEAFLTEVDTAIRNLYTNGNISPERRGEIELSLISCEHPLPNELQPALQTLLDSALPKFTEKMDMGKLYFWDTSWLGIEPSSKAHQYKYDIIRKIPLTKDMKLKVCRRCGAMSEIMSPEKTREQAGIISHVGKHCVCANYWIVD